MEIWIIFKRWAGFKSVCISSSIFREKMNEVKRPSNQERVIFGGPNINPSQQQGYAKTPPTNRGI